MNLRALQRQIAKGERGLRKLRDSIGRDDRLARQPKAALALEELGECLRVLSASLEDLTTAQEEVSLQSSAAVRDARRFEQLFRFAPDAYIVTDVRGVIRDLSVVAENWFGHARRYLVGKPMVSLVARADANLFLLCLAALREREQSLEDQTMRFGEDPGFDGSLSAKLQDGSEGREIRWMLRDVTQRRRAERALRASDARSRAALDAAFDGILASDAAGVIRSSNTALRRMFGYQWAGELEGKPVEVLGLASEALAEMVPGSIGEWVGIRRDGSAFPSQIVVGDKRSQSERIFSVRDLSVQRQLETQLKIATAATAMVEERERQRLAADLHDDIGQLLSLAGIKVGMLRNATGGASAKLRDDLADLVSRAHQRTESLTFQLSPPILRDMGLTAAVEWLAEDLERAYGLSVHVEHDGEPSLDEPTRVTVFRSVRELLINAARHARTDAASVKLARDGSLLRVEIEDRGVGFDAERSTQGFGLLSARERVEGLGGRFEVESEVGGGTRARIVVAMVSPPKG
jgi:PAS domain S-box-containing protein